MDRSEERRSSVRSLQELYTVAIGVSLGIAISRVVREQGFPILTTALPGFAAFTLTVVPFYHGTMRHLDRAFVEEGGRSVRRGTLLADFMLKFVEACGFLGIANVLDRPAATAWGLLFLLAFNVLWGTAVATVFRRRRQITEETAWVVINTVTVIVCGALLSRHGSSISAASADGGLAVSLILAAVVRTGLDYALCWKLYYPEDAS